MTKFEYLEEYDKLELVYLSLKKYEIGATSSQVSRDIDCSQPCAWRLLRKLYNLNLITKTIVGNYKLYKIKETDKQFCIRKYLEDVLKLQKNVKKVS